MAPAFGWSAAYTEVVSRTLSLLYGQKMDDGHLCVCSPVQQVYPVVGRVLIVDDRLVAKTVE